MLDKIETKLQFEEYVTIVNPVEAKVEFLDKIESIQDDIKDLFNQFGIQNTVTDGVPVIINTPLDRTFKTMRTESMDLD